MEGLLVAIYVFVLAMFVGFEVITKVPQVLHTPLMSGSNAISGITIIGAVVVAGRIESPLATALGVTAVIMATVNVVGGFLVTDRMLQMFRRRPEPARAAVGTGAGTGAGVAAPAGGPAKAPGGAPPTAPARGDGGPGAADAGDRPGGGGSTGRGEAGP